MRLLPEYLDSIQKTLNIMMFDVESIGLHGEGFAFGYVVFGLNKMGMSRIASGIHSCNPDLASGLEIDRDWVEKCVSVPDADCVSLVELRSKFWDIYMKHRRESGIMLFSDCIWPVESNFISACINDDLTRIGDGPYPIYDLMSIMLSKGFDPHKHYPRLETELPEHNPLCDARQSARLLATILG